MNQSFRVALLAASAALHYAIGNNALELIEFAAAYGARTGAEHTQMIMNQ
jgi:hypothetical protein